MAKRIISIVLALLMLVPVLIACKKDGATDGETTSSNISNDPVSTETSAEDKYNFNILNTLPSANYGGKDFNIAIQDEVFYNFDAEEITGDLANDVLYNWMRKIENRYNVKINTQKNGVYTAFFDNIGPDLLSGQATINLYSYYAYRTHIPVLNGYFRDWNTLGKMIDLTADRWDQNLNKEVTYNGKLLAATGDLGISKLQTTIATYFNVDLLSNYGYEPEDLYKLVDEKKWTLEALETIAKDIYEDTDADEERSTGDTYGYVSVSGNNYDIWFPAFNIKITSRDNTGAIIPTLSTDRNQQVLERLNSFYHNHPGIAGMSTGNSDKEWYGGGVSENVYFKEGRAGFVSSAFLNVNTSFIEMGTEAFGILPQPMLDEDQKDVGYISKLNDQYAIWGIAITLPESEIDFTAHITDALCAESANTVYYNYYDIMLKSRYSRDLDTARMVDIVMDNVSFDTVFMFGGALARGETFATSSGYPYIVRRMIMSNDNGLHGEYAGIATQLTADLQKVYDAYK